MVRWRLMVVWQLSAVFQPMPLHWTLTNCTLGMKNKYRFIRCYIIRPQSLTCFCFPGYGGCFGPRWHHWPQRSSCMYLVCHPMCQALCDFSLVFLAMMEWSFVLFLSIRDPRVTKEVEGRRCVALFWWILFCLYCEHRIGYLVWRQHTAQPSLPSGLFISYCGPLFVVTLTVTLSCCGNPVRVINVGCLLLSSFLRGLLSAHTQA